MEQVAKEIGLEPPTPEDLEMILREIDDDFDGEVSKDEFFRLVLLILNKTLETEDDITEQVNDFRKKQLEL